MINAIFGFDATSPSSEKWIFNTNHLFLALVAVVCVVCLCLIISPKSDVGKKICKLCFALVLLLLEVGRMIYRFKYFQHFGYTSRTINWWLVINFHSCSISTWITIGTLIASCFVQKGSKALQFFYNIMFGCGLLGGILTFAYPLTIDGHYPIYHFLNLQTIITHALIVVVPILLVKMGELKVQLKNVWQLFIYYTATGCIALAASICGNFNFAFTIEMNWMTLNIPFPYHIFVIEIVLVAFEVVVYGVFELCRYIKNKKLGIHPQKQHINKADLFITIFMYATSIVITSVIYSVIALNVWQGKATLWGLLELLPLCYLVISMLYCNYYSRYITKRFDTERTAKHTVLILCFCVLNLPAGIAYFVRYATAFNQYIKQI
ncbi:MAG: YwaF family protein [Clostridia bacterium]|nr:YwaF family protein [Clostridia bacterium]